jgi:hypothetical protein
MPSKFWLAFQAEIEKAAEERPGLLSRLGGKLKAAGGKLKSGVKWGTIGGLGVLGYSLYNILKGVTQAHSELQQEGQV